MSLIEEKIYESDLRVVCPSTQEEAGRNSLYRVYKRSHKRGAENILTFLASLKFQVLPRSGLPLGWTEPAVLAVLVHRFEQLPGSPERDAVLTHLRQAGEVLDSAGWRNEATLEVG